MSINPAEIDEANRKKIEESNAGVGDYAICSDTSHFSDDVWTECCECGETLCHRPYLPKEVKKICMRCVSENFGKHKEEICQ